MTKSTSAYDAKLSGLKSGATEKALKERWKTRATALLNKLQEDVASLPLGMRDLFDLLENLFMWEEFPEAQIIEVLYDDTKLLESVGASHLVSLQVGRGQNSTWSVSVWSFDYKIKIIVKLSA